MQTFLPFSNFAQSAKCLDRQRLGKQRVEAKQILKALVFGGGWANHPAVRMWRGFEPALCEYGDAMVSEWCRRGYVNGMDFPAIAAEWGVHYPADAIAMPPWLGDPAFHRSHQSNLMRKDRFWYKQFFLDVPPDIEYVWPSASD